MQKNLLKLEEVFNLKQLESSKLRRKVKKLQEDLWDLQEKGIFQIKKEKSKEFNLNSPPSLNPEMYFIQKTNKSFRKQHIFR